MAGADGEAMRQRGRGNQAILDRHGLMRATEGSEEPVHDRRVRRRGLAHQPVFAAVEAFDLELLSRLDAVLPADFRGQNDLAFAGNARRHAVPCKKPSYYRTVKPGIDYPIKSTFSNRQAEPAEVGSERRPDRRHVHTARSEGVKRAKKVKSEWVRRIFDFRNRHAGLTLLRKWLGRLLGGCKGNNWRISGLSSTRLGFSLRRIPFYD